MSNINEDNIHVHLWIHVLLVYEALTIFFGEEKIYVLKVKAPLAAKLFLKIRPRNDLYHLFHSCLKCAHCYYLGHIFPDKECEE